MAKIKEPLYIVSVDDNQSRYGGMIYTLEMIGVVSRDAYHTYVDPNNRNYTQWRNVIEVARRKGVIINNTRLKEEHEHKRMVNADSVFTIECVCPREEINQQLEQFWRDQEQASKRFGNGLFGFDPPETL